MKRAGVTSDRWSSANSAPAAAANPGAAPEAASTRSCVLAHRGPHDPLTGDAAKRAAADPHRGGERADQAPEGEHLGAEHEPLGGQLAPVVVDVGGRRHHEQRLAIAQLAQAVQDGAGLGGVGGSGDQGQGHGLHRVARAPDGIVS